MDVPLLSLPDAKERGDNLKKYFSRVLLKDVRRGEMCGEGGSKDE